MKNCPYCAENIQDAAIKCRFCGEWIEQEPKPEDIANEAIDDLDEDIKNETAGDPEYSGKFNIESAQEETGLQVEKESHDTTPRKLPWGWGWIILVSLLAWVFLNHEVNLKSELASGSYFLFSIVIIAITLIPYFWIRKILARRKIALHLASFIAGIISLFIGGFMNGISAEFHKQADRRETWAELESSQESISQEVTPLLERENAIWERLNLEPETYDEEQETIQYLKELLGIVKEKQSQASNYLAKYFHYYKGSRSTEYASFSSNMEKFYFVFNNKYQKSIELLIKYFTTGDESIGEEGFDLLSEAMELQEEFESQLIEFQKQIEKK